MCLVHLDASRAVRRVEGELRNCLCEAPKEERDGRSPSDTELRRARDDAREQCELVGEQQQHFFKNRYTNVYKISLIINRYNKIQNFF